jgi:hypothetical protein
MKQSLDQKLSNYKRTKYIDFNLENDFKWFSFRTNNFEIDFLAL